MEQGVYLRLRITPTFKHHDYWSAKAEAERLSEAHQRKAYILASVQAINVVTTISTIDMEDVKFTLSTKTLNY